MRKILLTMVAVFLFAAACGDDSSSLAERVGDADASADDSDADGSGSDESQTDDSDDSGSDDSGAGSESDFCMFSASVNTGLDDLDLTMTADEIKDAFGNLTDTIDQAASLAPGEVAADVQLLSDGVKGFVEVLAEYDFNFLSIPDSASDDPRFAAVSSPEYEAAADRVNAYCGVDDDGSATDPAVDDSDDPPAAGLPTDEMRDIVIQSLQAAYGWDDSLAECVVDELGLEDPTNIDPSVFGDPTAEVCGQPVVELFGG